MNRWVLSIITKGYAIKLEADPPFVLISSSETLKEEIGKLLLKDTMKLVPPQEKGLSSRYFTVLKWDGGLQPILSLRVLNEFIAYRQFWIFSFLKEDD